METANLISYDEAAKLLCVSVNRIRYGLATGLLPSPAVRRGQQRYFTLEQIPALRQAAPTLAPRENGHWYTPTKVAKLLSTTRLILLRAAHDLGTTWGKRKYFDENDVALIRERLAERQVKAAEGRYNTHRVERKDSGRYSQKEAARLLGIPVATFHYHLGKNHFPRPTHLTGYILCYNDDELELMRQWLTAHYRPRGKKTNS